MSPPRDFNETTVREPFVSPYSNNNSDPYSNVSRFQIIDTTLRGTFF
jgi:homocitrate synthase